VRVLRARGKFKARAITRDPAKHRGIADEVVEANLDRPASLRAALEGAYGVFLVTNFWEPGTDEGKQRGAHYIVRQQSERIDQLILDSRH
jgi:uncharacterized protein YbjT (DUF2867 family)